VPAELKLEILAQPNDETCGPTCLHAVYRYLGDAVPLDQVIEEVRRLGTGGTLAAYLGLHALERGHHATIYTYNLGLFDPTWFLEPEADLGDRLRAQARSKTAPELQAATRAYLDFLAAGGVVRHEELRPDLIRRYLARGLPMMSGLSATYLYGAARERYDGEEAVEDSVLGLPTGHFVVLHGYEPDSDSVLVADPYHENPLLAGPNYRVGIMRLLGAIMLGVLTYDGNLLVIDPERAS
jgi:hypothetical protein